jgi:hypothetical protein
VDPSPARGDATGLIPSQRAMPKLKTIGSILDQAGLTADELRELL